MTDGFTPLEQITQAVREGVRSEAQPVGRHLAEVRGLSVRAIRSLERIEQTVGSERSARIDDLGVLVDLIAAGWQTVDERLARIEELLGADERVDLLGLHGAEQDALSAGPLESAGLLDPPAEAA